MAVNYNKLKGEMGDELTKMLDEYLDEAEENEDDDVTLTLEERLRDFILYHAVAKGLL